MAKSTIFVDIETFHGFFFIGMKRLEDGKRIGFELSDRSDFNRDQVRKILLRNTTVGYNSLSYDLPMIWYALQDGVTNAMLKTASDRIIKGGIKWWDVEDELGISIPYDVKQNHVDLMEPQPNAFAGLKALVARMHGKRLQELPFDPDHWPTHADMDALADYCLVSDLDGTHDLWNTLAEPLAMRRALSEEYGQNFMSKSDAQIGEAIVKTMVERATGKRPQKAKNSGGAIFRYPIADWMKFDTPELQAILDRLRETDFIVKSDGKVDLPEWLRNTSITLGGATYQMGIGGLHSTEANRARHTTDTHVLVDADVASQYPSIILMLGLYPLALGPAFLKVYGDIKLERMKAKKRGKQVDGLLKKGVDDPELRKALEIELEQCNVKDKGFKIALNGVYGKLGSLYSILYAPHLMISVTLTGQLTLLMLIEKALARGIDVISGNTDGVLFHCPRHMYGGLTGDRLLPSALEEVTSEWEKITGFDLEFGEYRSIYNQSVNSYFAIKPNGGHKRKGPLGNPWNPSRDDFDAVRGQLMKNPQATICSDAALNLIKDGKPIRDTIMECRDIRQFVTVIKASKGATWNGSYLGKTIRYYWGIGGAPIMEAAPNAATGNYKKVPKTDGAIPCMNLPDEFPDDIDYDRYVAETDEILTALGYYGDPRPPVKRVRLTKANRLAVLSTYAVAP